MIKKTASLLIVSTLLFSITGCEAFRKKFVRKPKREKEVKVVINPREYESDYSVEKAYKQYFLFWRISQEELLGLLNAQEGNRKRLLYSAKRVVENLEQMRQFCLPEKQARLDEFIKIQQDVVRQLDRYDLSRGRRLRVRSILKQQKRQIQNEFSFGRIQEYLIKK